MSEWHRAVEIAKDREDLLNVCRLRYHVYVDELKRENYNYIDNVQRILEDPLDHVDGVVNLMVKAPENAHANGFLAGCARIHVPVPDKYNDMFGILDAELFPGSTRSDFAFFSRFMVKAEFRGRNGTTDSIYEHSYKQAREMGAKYLLLNCTPALASAYERKGWVRYKSMYWDEGMGLQMPMCLPMEDVTFLSTLGSFSILPASMKELAEATTATATATAAAAATPSDDGTSEPAAPAAPVAPTVPCGVWLTSVLARFEAPLVSSKLCSPAAVQQFVRKHISVEQLDSVPLFEGTTSQERMEFLGSFGGCVPFIRVKAGDGISRVGDVRDEAFLVMNGRVRVEYQGTVLGYGGVGSLIGEKAFLSGAARALAGTLF
jgi:predicted GNAT family N-acyltransferase